MDKETWFGKTGLVMHEGFLMRTGKGATTKKRKWCKLLFDAKKNTAWIVYLHIDDKQLKDADSTPLWYKCGRPSYTADGPTFQRVS